MADWQLLQSILFGLLFSCLLAKLISVVVSFKEDHFTVSRNDAVPKPQSQPTPAADPPADVITSNEADSVIAEHGSVRNEDDDNYDDDDDDWEGVESTELDEEFSAATTFVAATAGASDRQKVSAEVQLQLYGLYKIATEGPCTSPQPSPLKLTACANWFSSLEYGLKFSSFEYRLIDSQGSRAAPNQIYASFTSDGRHIISASEDSNVYIWNCINQSETSPIQVKSIRSCERFSANASIAIPWTGLRHRNSENGWGFHVMNDSSPEVLQSYSPAAFSLSQEYFLESYPKGSATWPEEKLASSTPSTMSSSMHRSQYKFLKASCQNTATSHAWGLFIVTAGSDGRIRLFNNYGLPVSV